MTVRGILGGVVAVGVLLIASSLLVGPTAAVAQVAGFGAPSVSRGISGASTNAALILTGNREVRCWTLYSLDATPVYVKLYNKATAPDENDTPTITIAVETALPQSFCPRDAIAFPLGLGIRVVTGITDGSTGATSANEVIWTVSYR